MSGGGGGGGTTTSYTSNVPEFAKQPFMDMIGKAEALTQTPYQTYTGDRQAQFTPLQQQAANGAANLGPSQQTQQASGLAGLAAQQGMSAGNYQGAGFSLYGAPQQMQAQQVNGPQGFLGVSSGPGPQQVGTQSFLQPGTASAYMNPYMQNVVDIQKREATRQDAIQGQSRNAAAVAAGAFGGSRQAIMEAEAQRNLNQRLDDLQAQGSNAAFQQAQQQFNNEQQLGLNAQQANQQAGLTYGQQGLTAQQANQQAGLQLNNQQLQAALANQQAGLTAGQANQQAGLQYNNQFLDAQRAAEQSRQFGAQQGMQGAQIGLQAANTLGHLGNDQFGQRLQALQTQNTIGGQQQQNVQNILNQQYADFQAQRDYPYQQIGFLSDLLRGTGSSTRSLYPQASPLQTVAGLGTAAAGLAKAGGFKQGGRVKAGLADIAPDDMDFADGGIVGYADGGKTEDDYSDAVQNVGAVAGYTADQLGRKAADRAALAGRNAQRAALRLPPVAATKPGLGARLGGGLGSLARGNVAGAALATPFTTADTETAAYYKRFGLNPEDANYDVAPGANPLTDPRFYKDLGIRALGAASDLGDKMTLGLAGRMYRDKQTPDAAPGSRPAAAPAQGQDTIVTPPIEPQGSAAGIAKLTTGTGAPPVPGYMSLDKVAAMYNGQSSLPGDLAAIQAANADVERAQREKATNELADYDKMVQEAGPAGAEREAAIKKQAGELGGKADRAQSQALIQAGLAILSADPSRGAWAAIGQGLGVGFKQYRGDIAELEQRKAQLDDQMAQIAELRRAEKLAQGKDRSVLRGKITDATIEAKKNAAGLLTTLLPLKAQQTQHTVDSFMRGYEAYQQRVTQQNIAGMMSASRVEAASMRGLGSLQKGSPDYVDELRKRVADLSKNPMLTMQMQAKERDPLKQQRMLEDYARQQLDQDIAAYGRQAQSGAPGAVKLPPGTKMTVTP